MGPSWLARVIALVLVWLHSIEKRSNAKLIQKHINKTSEQTKAETYRLRKLWEKRGTMWNMRSVCVRGSNCHWSVYVDVGVRIIILIFDFHGITCTSRERSTLMVICIWAKGPIMSKEIPASVAWNDCDYFYSLLDGIIVHRKFAGTHLYTWVETGTVRVKCLARKQKTMSHGQAH